MRRVYRVELDVPDEVTDGDMRNYIDEAVCSWKGSLCPGTMEEDFEDRDPLFDLDPESVIVHSVSRSRKCG